MAHFRRSAESFSPMRTVTIIGSEFVDDHTVYNVQICVGLYKWCVRHRYSDFHALHDKLTRQFQCLDWSLLPKKKLFGSQTEQFILKRQAELEIYLQSLIRSLPYLPSDLMKFLDFHKYEVHGITENLTEIFFESGESILQSNQTYHISPLQIFAICTRLALPEPTCDSGDLKKDIGHLLDFVTRLKRLQINGSTLPVGRSNINMNGLDFDLHCFKSLTHLNLSSCNLEKISEVEHLKRTIVEISVNHSLTSLKEILLIGVGRGQLSMCDENMATLLVQPWASVQSASFIHNRISHIDESVKLLPNVELLDLSHNYLDAIDNLQHLSRLRRVILAHNLIRRIPALHTKLGNITLLDLSDNKLETLEGLGKLYSLEVFNASHNDISQITEVKFVGGLPCLEVLDLRDNPVNSTLDYRTTVFEMFVDRASELCLDGAKPTSQEIELVAVRSALSKSRELKRSNQKPTRKVHVNEPTIADAEPSEPSTSPSASASQSFSGANPVANLVGASSLQDAATRDRASVTSPDKFAPATGKQHHQHLITSGELLARKDLRPEASLFPLGHLKRVHRKPTDSESALGADGGDSRKRLKSSKNIMLPETLPSATDSAFCAHLQTLLPSGNQKDSNSESNPELPIHILWCTAAAQHVRLNEEFPGCVYVTTDNVHVFNVRSLVGDRGVPQLLRTVKLPLEKVTQITIGYEGLYLQVEWASTEPRTHGIIAFLTFSSGKTDAFINAIKLARRRSIPELDDYEDPHVVPARGLEASLKGVLNAFERCSNPSDIQVLLYMLVMVEGTSVDVVKTYSLVVTSRFIYLVSQDYCNTPLPSFMKNLPSSPVLEVESIFPVTSRIVNIQLYDIDSIESGNNHSLLSTFSNSGQGIASSVGFIGYGVRISFHLGEYGIQVLDVRMPTSNLRDRFLNTLVRVHGSISEAFTNPSLQKFKSLGGLLRESDSLSCDSSGSLRSSGRLKGKRNKKKPNGALLKLSSPLKQADEEEKENKKETSFQKNQTDLTLPEAANLPKETKDVEKVGLWDSVEISAVDQTFQDFGTPVSDSYQGKTTLELGATGNSSTAVNPVTSVQSYYHRITSSKVVAMGTSNFPLEAVSESRSLDGGSDVSNQNGRIGKELPANPFDDSGTFHLADSIRCLDTSQNNSFQSAQSSVKSLSPSSHDSFREDIFQRHSAEDESLDNVDDAVSMDSRKRIISDSDIAVIRLALGEFGSTDVLDRRVDFLPVNLPPRLDRNRIRGPEFEKLPPVPGIETGRLTTGRSPPKSLPFPPGYPSSELLLHLSECFEAVPLFPPISTQFEAFMSMSGLELINYFHQNVAVISTENEELRHVFWAFVVPYKEPSLEIPSCILLSTKAMYFVSDRCEPQRSQKTDLGKSHKRHSSDSSSLHLRLKRESDELSSKWSSCQLSCGILNNSTFSEQKRVLRAFATILLKDLKQVNVGIFSQSVRLTGSDERTVYSCVTHDCHVSEAFLHELKNILGQFYPLPSPDINLRELEQDFYTRFSKPRSRELKLSTDSRFVYPPDDCISDITYLIRKSLKDQRSNFDPLKLLSYLLCFHIEANVTAELPLDVLYGKPRTLILTEDHLVLATEDHVSYPLPDFARMPPARQQFEIIEVRYLECLRKITLHSDDVHVIVLAFSDETEEFVVDTSIEHFRSDREPAQVTPEPIREITWTLLIQNGKSRDKLIRLISQQWEEQHGGHQLTINTLP